MDDPNWARFNVHAEVNALALHDDPEMTALAIVAEDQAKLERTFGLRREAFDWNCHQRLTERDVVRRLVPSATGHSSSPKMPSCARRAANGDLQ